MGNFKWYRKLRGGCWYKVSPPMLIDGVQYFFWVRGAENIPGYFSIMKMERY